MDPFADKIQPLTPSSAVVRTAADAPLLRFNRHLKGGAHTWQSHQSGWQLPLTFAALAGNEDAVNKWMAQLNFSLEPDNCLTTSGGYPAQHELHLVAMYTLAKLDSAFWHEKISPEQQKQIELLMKAAVISSAFTTADASYADNTRARAMDGGTNFSRGWNPNFREGMFGMLIAGTVFFGGTDEVNQILNHYDHEAFVKELKDAELMNTHETFTWSETHPESGAPRGETIAANIRNYRYHDKPLMHPMDLYTELTLHTYGAQVNCGLNNGKGIMYKGIANGIIASGCEGLPNKGADGMLYEFDAKDAGGKRSSITYALSGFKPNLINHTLVVMGGYWQKGPEADELISRMNVGITDLQYKLEKGYYSYSKGKGKTKPFTINEPKWTWAFNTLFPWWENQWTTFHRK
ncbi:hypothetical protein P0Y35_12385 [Kiritimatiellaeota bacterium B1221]|nr:hypothetical protein [Kiritimatiellaeota bacterium B1221]